MFDLIFKPKSIAVVGASRDKGKLGHDILENITRFGYKGKVYPINPKAKTILGHKAYKSVKDVKGKLDLAVIVVPAQIVNKVLIECGKKKIKNTIIISAGFKETGKEGAKRENQIKKTAQIYKINVVGPNCLGILNPHEKLNSSFASGMPKAGTVGFISQSGAMAVAMLDWAYTSKIGFSKIISIGNKADVSEIDLMNYMAKDPETKVIMMYLESIPDGLEFMQAAAKITTKKPIIVLKSGRSEQGQHAVSSHTGSLAGSDAAVDAAFRQCGVIRAQTVEDLFDFAKGFSMAPLPKGPGVAIVTNAGGPGIMATDALAGTNLRMAFLKLGTKNKMKKSLPEAASVYNPVDIIGDAEKDRYEVALKGVISDSNVHSILTILTPQTMTQEDETALLIGNLSRRTTKPLLTCFMGGEDVNSGRLILRRKKIPNFEYPGRAMNTLDKMYLANQIKSNKGLAKYKSKNKKIKYDTSKFQLKTMAAENLLAQYKIPVLKSKLFGKPRDLSQINDFPIAMKIASRDIVHKLASGALLINIQNEHQAKAGYKQIVKNVKKQNRKAEIDGVLVQPMAEKGTEIIIGMKRDPNFGPVILFGLGGSFVEVLKDISLRIAPFNKTDATNMIKEIKAFNLLKDADTKLIADTLVKLSHLAMDYPQITEIDMNPMIVQKKGGQVVDVRMLIK
ncbi:MAG: acetate--CoA ligase alpha subunit [Patescibacteria group bacterium]